jgi:glycosyltransferase involved in cell wall biosynthesis
MRIYGWAVNHSGCGQYRIGLPMWALQQAGHDAIAFSALNTALPDDLDILVGQLVCTPERSEIWQDLAARPNRSTALVYELDDDVWNTHSSNAGAHAFRDKDTLASIEANLALADAVTVTTDELAAQVCRFNPNVHVIPNCVDDALLRRPQPAVGPVTIGWAGGSSHHNDFAFVQSELRSFLRRNPGIELHVIGTDYRRELGRPSARHTEWSENLVEYLNNIDFTIGIAPLAYHAFNKSKSDLKVLEYAALGIPVVASDFGPYSQSVQHGVTGYLVKRPHEWGKYLRELVEDADARRELGENARRWAATRTVQGNVWRWEAAYANVLASLPARNLSGAGQS